MNVQTKSPATTSSATAPRAPREPQVREFGTGYGRSSGYASARRYVPEAGYARFRCA
jgi:hypothetical protein